MDGPVSDPLRAAALAERRRAQPHPEPEPAAAPIITQGVRSPAAPSIRAALTPDEALRRAVRELRGRPRWVRL